MSLWSRLKQAVAEVFGFAPAPPPREEAEARAPAEELRVEELRVEVPRVEVPQLDVEEPQLDVEEPELDVAPFTAEDFAAVVVEEEEPPPELTPARRAFARERALALQEREQVDRAALVELRWWDRLELAPEAERTARAEQSLAAQLGTVGAGRGHPALLPPLELLQAWGGYTEAQAVRELARLSLLVGEEAAGELQELRARSLESFRAEMGTRPPLPLVAQPPEARAELQGSAITAWGAVEDVVSVLWDKWVRSTLSGPGVAPPAVTLGLGDLPRDIARLVELAGGTQDSAGGWQITIPGTLWRLGPDAVLDWLLVAGIPVTLEVYGEIDAFDTDDSKEEK